jgi:putative ribosome biogenesis GTPase RsgA
VRHISAPGEHRLITSCARAVPFSSSLGSFATDIMADKRKETFQYKIVLLGESGVGKSNLVLQFVKV